MKYAFKAAPRLYMGTVGANIRIEPFITKRKWPRNPLRVVLINLVLAKIRMGSSKNEHLAIINLYDNPPAAFIHPDVTIAKRGSCKNEHLENSF